MFYYQICCIVIPKNDNTDYSNDYLIYAIQYSSNIIIPQSAINDFNSYRIIMIVITIFLFLVLSCFFIIISYMNNDKKPYFFNSVAILLNIFLQIILNYLIGPIIILCLTSFICKNGINDRFNSVCLTQGKYIIYNILAIINSLFYLVIAIFVANF